MAGNTYIQHEGGMLGQYGGNEASEPEIMRFDADVQDKIRSFIASKGYGEDTLLKLRLTGSVSPWLVINRGEIERGSYGLFALKAADGTIPVHDPETLKNDTSFYGELYRVLRPQLESGDEREREVALRAFRYAVAAVAGENIV